MKKEQIMKAETLWIRYSMAAVLPLAALLTTPAEAISLQTLIDTNGSITVGDKLFSDFLDIENGVSNDTTGRAAFDLENIDVLAWPDTGAGPGLDFVSLNNELSITQAGVPTADGDLDFIFRVSVIDIGQDCFPDCIIDNTLQAFFAGDGLGECPPGLCDNFAEVRERLFLNDPLINPGPVIDENGVSVEKDVHWEVDESTGDFDDQSGQVVERNFDGTKLGSDPDTSGPLSELWVLKDLRLLTSNPGEFVAINSFNQHFSQVPEPTTLALLGMGLAGLAFGRRRKRA